MVGFIPVERPRIAVAQDGTLAAIVEPTRITLVTLPAAAPFGVIALDPMAAGTDVGWLDDRLLVLARHATRSRMRVIDPHAARVIAERDVDGAWHVGAVVDRHALAIGDAGATIVSCTDEVIVRAVAKTPAIAGRAGSRFVFATGTSIEEWDPAELASKRRWRVPATPTALGGSERVLWWRTREAPRRIDVTPLVARNQPRSHELPEPIVDVAGHPRSDLLACLGESGRVFVVDLDGHAAPRVLDTSPVARADAIALVVGTDLAVLASESGRPTTVVSLAAAPVMATWRDELVAWTQSGIVARVPIVDAIEELARRFEIPAELTPAITLCYGAHLCGAPGVPPLDLAHLLGGRWDEALGAGRLAASGLLVFEASWVTLAPPIQDLLDAV